MEDFFQHERNLVCDRSVKSKLDVVRVTESQFADDMVLNAGSRDRLESVAVKFVEEAYKWEMTVRDGEDKGNGCGRGARRWGCCSSAGGKWGD